MWNDHWTASRQDALKQGSGCNIHPQSNPVLSCPVLSRPDHTKYGLLYGAEQCNAWQYYGVCTAHSGRLQPVLADPLLMQLSSDECNERLDANILQNNNTVGVSSPKMKASFSGFVPGRSSS